MAIGADVRYLILICTLLMTRPCAAQKAYPSAADLQQGLTSHSVSVPLTCIAASASGTAYTCTTSPTFTPAGGDEILFKADVANTGATTLNVDSSSAAGVKKQGGGTALVANDFLAGQWAVLTFDGTFWQMQGQTGNAAGGAPPVSSTYLDLIFPAITPTLPVDANYSWVNQTTASKVVNTGGSIYLVAAGNSSLSWALRTKPQPATPYTIDVIFSAVVPLNFNRTGIGFRESSTGKLTVFEFESRGVDIENLTNPTTFASGVAGATSTSNGFSGIVFYRIANDGTNLTYSMSPDGRNYIQVAQQAKAAFFTTAPDQVFFGAASQQANSVPGAMTLISWFEH